MNETPKNRGAIGFDRAQAVKGAARYHRPDCVSGMACARLRRLPDLLHLSIVPGINKALESSLKAP
jgi:hypothetical protein